MAWDIEPGLPAVWADRQSLMQVFLNLTKNSQRAMLDQPVRAPHRSRPAPKASVSWFASRTPAAASRIPSACSARSSLERKSTGLGVYLSRALMRSFRGDLRYEPESAERCRGSTFIVELSAGSNR